MNRGILFTKYRSGRFSGTRVELNRFNVFPDVDCTPKANRVEHEKVLMWICKLIFQFFPIGKFIIVFDCYCLKTNDAALTNSLAHFFQKRPFNFLINKKVISFWASDESMLFEFVRDYVVFCDDLFMRVFEQNQDNIQNLDYQLQRAPGGDQIRYAKNLKNYHSAIIFSSNPIFAGFISIKDSFEEFEKILYKVGKQEGFSPHKVSEEDKTTDKGAGLNM